MKTKLILIVLTLILSSWTLNESNRVNSNTWCISIGNKDLLIWTKNEIGDVALINKKLIKPADVLHVQRYYCGQSAENSTTKLTIKNNFDKVIKEYEHKNNSMMFEADAPMKDFLPEFISGQTIKIYFSISGTSKKLETPVLLGQLKLK